jgi:hypothetical protein
MVPLTITCRTRSSTDPGSGTDFNRITDTTGGPRVIQFGLKVKF